MKPLPRPDWEGSRPRGRVEVLQIDSRLLRGNLLGDPHVRELPVWLPPGYDEGKARLPVVFYLAGFLGVGRSKLQWKVWTEGAAARLDRLRAEKRIGDMIVAFPDCMTLLGGSQYIDSSVCGPYASHLVRELVPAVDRRFRTLGSRDHRAVVGKSSGGFGAMVHAMLHPETWGAAACHSGDSYFEFCFFTDLPRSCREIARAGGVRPFIRRYWTKDKRPASEMHAMMHLAMAACFDPQPDHVDGFELPADLDTGAVNEERWAQWLRWDPVRMIPNHVDALKSMRCLFIDCGGKDQYHLQFGARHMQAALKTAGIPHFYEEFNDNHSAIDYRLDESLPRLWRAIRA